MNPTPPAKKEPQADTPHIEFITKKERPSYELYISYPKLTFGSANLSREVNQRTAQLVARKQREFNRLIAADYLHEGAFLAYACSVSYASEGLLSIGCDSYEFNGGAHGIKGYDALNLTLPELRELRVDDVLHLEGARHAKLVRLCDANLARNDRDSESVSFGLEYAVGGAAHDPPPRFDTFTISRHGLTFYFKHQLAHVIADAIVPDVKWDELSTLLKPTFAEKVPVIRQSGTSAKAPIDPWCVRGGDCQE